MSGEQKARERGALTVSAPRSRAFSPLMSPSPESA